MLPAPRIKKPGPSRPGLQNLAAIREGREPNSSVQSVIDCYRVIGELAASLEAQDGWS